MTLQLSRHTYTQIGKKYFGYSEGQMDYQLNHSVKGTSNTYQKGEDTVEIRDYRHYQLINHFDINDILWYLFTSTKAKFFNGELIYYKRKKQLLQGIFLKNGIKVNIRSHFNQLIMICSLVRLS